MVSVWCGDEQWSSLFDGSIPTRCTGMTYIQLKPLHRTEYTLVDQLKYQDHIVLVDATNGLIYIWDSIPSVENFSVQIENSYNYSCDLYIYGVTSNDLYLAEVNIVAGRYDDEKEAVTLIKGGGATLDIPLTSITDRITGIVENNNNDFDEVNSRIDDVSSSANTRIDATVNDISNINTIIDDTTLTFDDSSNIISLDIDNEVREVDLSKYSIYNQYSLVKDVISTQTIDSDTTITVDLPDGKITDDYLFFDVLSGAVERAFLTHGVVSDDNTKLEIYNRSNTNINIAVIGIRPTLVEIIR